MSTTNTTTPNDKQLTYKQVKEIQSQILHLKCTFNRTGDLKVLDKINEMKMTVSNNIWWL